MRKRTRHLMYLAVVIILVVSNLCLNKAVAVTDVNVTIGYTSEDLVSGLMGEGVSAISSSVSYSNYNQIGKFSNGTSLFGISSGVILSTGNAIIATTTGTENSDSSGVDNTDPDLEKLITSLGNKYGGDTASLQFEMTATGNLLNFKYAFASSEFTQSVNYNDIFGLFVSVNGGEFENIALLDNGSIVTIKNLRAGKDGTQLSGGTQTISPSTPENQDYFTADYKKNNGSIYNGISNVFTAQKEVNVGDDVVVKFVIADVGDKAFSSSVLIAAGSLNFQAPESKIDFKSEKLSDFKPGSEYIINVDGDLEDKEYSFIADESGSIPLIGTDKNGNEYNFIGKTLNIVEHTDDGDSDEQKLIIDGRPDKPKDPTVPSTSFNSNEDELDVHTTKNSITINGSEECEYSIDNGQTWISVDDNGIVKFDGLREEQIYIIKTRKKATETSLASEVSDGIEVGAYDMLCDYVSVQDYYSEYDGQMHTALITLDETVSDAQITYSTTNDGEFSADVIEHKDKGEYEDYYCVSKQGCYPVYGKFRTHITEKIITVTPKSDQSKKMGNDDAELEFDYTGNVEGETPGFDGKLSREEGEEEGEYSILPGDITLLDNGDFKSSNYELTFTENVKYYIYADMYEVDGSEEDWNKKDVTIRPINGYVQISEDGDAWYDDLTISDEGENHVMFKVRKSDEIISEDLNTIIRIDKTKPVITGYEKDKEYFTTRELNISDNFTIGSITIDGEELTKMRMVTDSLFIDGNIEKTYEVKVTDKAGNESAATIKMNPISDIMTPIEKLTVENVKEKDRENIQSVLEKLEKTLDESISGTVSEIKEINDDIEKCKALLAKLDREKKEDDKEDDKDETHIIEDDKKNDEPIENLKPEPEQQIQPEIKPESPVLAENNIQQVVKKTQASRPKTGDKGYSYTLIIIAGVLAAALMMIGKRNREDSE